MAKWTWLRCGLVLLAVSALWPTSSAIGAVVTYTYSYDDVSARPENYNTQGETQGNPHVLNDGTTAVGVGSPWEAGKGLQLYFGNSYQGVAAATDRRPSITLTLDSAADNLNKLTVWYFSGGMAGVNGPGALTIADSLGTTTTANGFVGNGGNTVVSYDVPLAGFTGQVLYLNFSKGGGEFVGISEVRLFASDPSWSVDADGNWSDEGNWSGPAPDGAGLGALLGDAITADRTVTLDTAVTLGSLTLNNSSAKYTIDGTQTLSMDFASGATIDVTGQHAIRTPVQLESNLTLNVAGGGSLAVSGAISEGFWSFRGITKTGGGVLELSGENTYAGGTAVNGGVLRLTGDDNRLNTAGTLALNGGTLDVQANQEIAGLTVSSADSIVTVAEGKTFTVTGDGAFNATLFVQGTGEAIFNGTTYTGAALRANENGTATFNSGDMTTTAFVIAGSVTPGTIRWNSPGTLTPGTRLYVGFPGAGANGTFIQTAGTVNGGAEGLEYNAPSSVYQLDGGTLRTIGINKWEGGGVPAECVLAFNGGTLQAAASFQFPVGTGLSYTIADGKTAVIDTQEFNATLNGVITGPAAAGLAKQGAGTLVLGGANTYTGVTSVNAGTLQIAGTLGETDVTVQGGATLLAPNTTIGSTAAGSLSVAGQGALSMVNGSTGVLYLPNTTTAGSVLTLGGAAGEAAVLDFEIGPGLTHDTISIGGLLTINPGGAVINVTGLSGFSWGTYDLITFPDGQASGLSYLTLGTVPAGYDCLLQSTATAQQLVILAPPEWTGAAGSDWGTAANWASNSVPDGVGAVVAFGTAGSTATVDLGAADRTVGAMAFNGAVGTTIQATGTPTAGTLTLDSPQGNAAIDVVGQHAIHAGVQLADNLVITLPNNGDSLALSGIIGETSPNAALTKIGPGILVLSGASTYSGGTTINGGKLQLTGGDNRLNPAGRLTLKSATLDLQANQQIAGLEVGTGDTFVSVSEGNTLTVEGNTTANGGTLYVQGLGKTVFNGAEHNGNLRVNASGTAVFSTGNLTAPNWVIVGNATSGALEWNSPGTLNFGTRLYVGFSGGQGTLTQTAGIVGAGGDIEFNHASTYNLNGGTLRISSVNTGGAFGDTSGSTIRFGGGALQFTASPSTLNLAFAIGDGKTAVVDTPAGITPTIPGTISGGPMGALVKTGPGTLVLSGNNTYEGPTSVNAGALRLNYTINNTSKISATASLTLAGGTLEVLGNASGNTTQNVKGLTLKAGTSGVSVTSAAGLATTLDLTANGGTLARDPGAAANFTLNPNGGAAQVKLSGTPSAPLGGWATVNGNDWANLDANNHVVANGAFVAKNDETTWAENDSVSNDGAYLNAAGTLAIDSLQFNWAGAATASVAEGSTLTVNRGIMVTSAVGGNVQHISGGQIQASAGGELAIQQLNSNAAGYLQIDSLIADNGGSKLSIYGPGVVALTADNTFTGETVFSTPSLHIGNGTPAGSLAGNIVIANANSRLMLNRLGSLTLAGNISGPGGVSKIQTGTATLSGDNSYAGGTSVNSGQLVLGSGTALGTGQVNVNTYNGFYSARLDLNGQTIANKLVLAYSATGPDTQGCLVNGDTANTAVLNGDLQIGGNQYTGGNGNIVINGLVTGGVVGTGNDYAFYQQGAGTWTFANPANTFNGWYYIVGGGAVEVVKLANLNEPSSLGRATLAVNNRVFFAGNGGTLRYIGSDASTSDRELVVAGGSNVIDASGTTPDATLTLTGAATVNGVRTLTLTGTNTGNNTFQSAINGAVSVTKTGAGTWVLAGENLYSGATTVNGGILLAAKPAALPNYFFAGPTVAEGATLAVRASDGMEGWESSTIADLHSTTWFAAGSNLGIEVVSDTFEAPQLSGVQGLMKLGGGTLSLTYANTYEGGTTVRQGTLEVLTADALPAGTALTIGSGGTLVLGSGLTLAGGTSAAAAQAVPEPGTWALLAVAALWGLVARWYRRR